MCRLNTPNLANYKQKFEILFCPLKAGRIRVGYMVRMKNEKQKKTNSQNSQNQHQST
jgi:hypothetical protein